ncbi:hypothetical protein KKC74_05865, partial [bacterium]|nr:hypothetical protein [bacterium]
NPINKNIAMGYFKIGEKEFLNGRYKLAIDNYRLCQKTDISYTEKIKKNYAESVFQIAGRYKNSDYKKSSELYKEAIKIDKDYYKKVDAKFKSIRKNQFTNILSSSIPGWRQYCRKQKNYLYISGGFLSFSGLAIYYSISADQHYEDYKKASTNSEANSLYDETISMRNKNIICQIGAIGTILWSIVDSYNYVGNFNNTFTIPQKNYSIKLYPSLDYNALTTNFVFNF